MGLAGDMKFRNNGVNSKRTEGPFDSFMKTNQKRVSSTRAETANVCVRPIMSVSAHGEELEKQQTLPLLSTLPEFSDSKSNERPRGDSLDMNNFFDHQAYFRWWMSMGGRTRHVTSVSITLLFLHTDGHESCKCCVLFYFFCCVLLPVQNLWSWRRHVVTTYHSPFGIFITTPAKLKFILMIPIYTVVE